MCNECGHIVCMWFEIYAQTSVNANFYFETEIVHAQIARKWNECMSGTTNDEHLHRPRYINLNRELLVNNCTHIWF